MARIFDRAYRRRRALWGAGLCLTCVAASASAQDFDPRTRIEDRPRPEFASPPIAIGAFELVPQVEAGVEYVDNLFASDLIDVDDVIVSVRPSLSVTDRRPDREIRLDLATGYQTFLNNNSEDRLQFLATTRLRFGLGTSTRPFAGAEIRLNDSSQSQVTVGGNINQPLRAFSYGANAGVAQDIGSFTLEGEGRIARNTYDGEYVFRDQVFDVGFGDNTLYQGRGRVSYSSRPDQRIYVEARYGRFDYDGTLPTAAPGLPAVFAADRSGDNFSVVGGVQFQATELLSFDGNVGYSRLSYDDPSQPTIDAVSFEANAYYSPTRLTRFQLQARRTVDGTINPLFSNFLSTGVALRGEHELRRDLILRGDLEYVEYSAGDVGNIGDEFRAVIGALYYVSPRVSLNLRGEVFRREGISEGDQKRVMVSAAYTF